MEAVVRRVSHGLLIIALLCATGGHWAIWQSVAWATMLASNAQTKSLSVAIEQTFDGRHPCPICRQIAKARQSEKKSEAQPEMKKLEFSLERIAFVINAPVHFFTIDEPNLSAPLLNHAPPTPPPRGLPA